MSPSIYNRSQNVSTDHDSHDSLMKNQNQPATTNNNNSILRNDTNHCYSQLLSTSSTSRQSSSSSSCMPCIQLLFDAMQRTDSRPMQLLQHLTVQYNNEQEQQKPEQGSVLADSIQSSKNLSTDTDRLGTRSSTSLWQSCHNDNNKIDSSQLPYVSIVEDNTPLQQQKISWRRTPEGVQVMIPTVEPVRKTSDPSIITRISQLVSDKEASAQTRGNDNELIKHPPLHLQSEQQHTIHQLATSAIVFGNNEDNSTQIDKKQQKQNRKTMEWMSLSCKICSDTGPEANARAFVMGPYPLSIVICQNRLLQTPPAQSSSSSTATPTPTDTLTTTTSTNPPTNINSKVPITNLQRKEVDEILMHELMHVYDLRELNMDLRDCQNLAYSEIRAAREAECYIDPQSSSIPASVPSFLRKSNSNNYNKQPSKITTSTATIECTSSSNTHEASSCCPTMPFQAEDHNYTTTTTSTTSNSWSSLLWPSSSQSSPTNNRLLHSNDRAMRRCVRSKALLATNNLFPITGKSCVNAVFEQAYNDHRPFVFPPPHHHHHPMSQQHQHPRSDGGSMDNASNILTNPSSRQRSKSSHNRSSKQMEEEYIQGATTSSK